MKISVSKPVIGHEEIKNVNQALRSRAISGFFGKYIPEFEKKFSRFSQTKFGVSVSSGTTALHLALATLNISKGDEVIIPAITNMATYFSVIYQGAKPIPIDVNPQTLNIDPSLIERKITKKTKAIIVVHLFGLPVQMDPIMKIVKKYKIKLIEDCAEAHGAEYKGKRVGSFGDFGCFSFYANKIISTGEGGMLTTNNKNNATKAKNLKELAFGKKNKFIHSDIGYNYRLTNIQAAIGCGQMRKIKTIINSKRKIAERYQKLLDYKNYFILPNDDKNCFNVYWMYLLILKDEYVDQREFIMKKLKINGVETREGFVSATLQKFFIENKIISKKHKCPNAEKASFSAFYLPSSPDLSLKEQKYICESLINIMTSIAI